MEESRWLLSRVNYKQSPGDRKAKYDALKAAGVKTWRARRGRDWHWTKVNLEIEIQERRNNQ